MLYEAARFSLGLADADKVQTRLRTLVSDFEEARLLVLLLLIILLLALGGGIFVSKFLFLLLLLLLLLFLFRGRF